MNVSLVLIQISMYTVRRINRYFFENKSRKLKKAANLIRKAHPYTGRLLVITGIMHGYAMAGGLRIHSGYVAWTIILVTAFWGWAGPRYSIKNWLKVHRTLALIIVAAAAFHVLKMKFGLFR